MSEEFYIQEVMLQVGKMEISLCKALQHNKNIKVYENTMAIELLVHNNECGGVVVFNEDLCEYETVYSNILIMATGGLGQLYKYTTNPVGATGDGFAICYNAGAVLQDMELFNSIRLLLLLMMKKIITDF